MVQEADTAGLSFDTGYLKPFRPCFNSTMRNSLTLIYRLFGDGRRRPGQHRSDGEGLHQAAVDRVALKECGYAPSNLTPQLLGGTAPLPVVDTRGGVRAGPC